MPQPKVNPVSMMGIETGALEVDPPIARNPHPTPSNPSVQAILGAENLSSPIATRVDTTQVEKMSGTQQPLESYVPRLARAREA